jgi:hypothetical protein
MKKTLKLVLVTSVLAISVHALKAEATAAPKDNYPLTTCVVSGDELNGMGHSIVYTYKEKDKPDRIVKFCCKDCVTDFNKDPQKYLAILDAAEQKMKK